MLQALRALRDAGPLLRTWAVPPGLHALHARALDRPWRPSCSDRPRRLDHQLRAGGPHRDRAAGPAASAVRAGELDPQQRLCARAACRPSDCAGLYLYRRSRPIYSQLRSTIIATWVISIPVFALFPVAPPRVAEPGVFDSVSRDSPVALSGHSTLFYNPFAAVPSLHVGFAFALSIASVAALRNPIAKVTGALWAPVVVISVIATGNHYVVHIVAGLIAATLGFCLARYAARLPGRGKRLSRLRTGHPLAPAATLPRDRSAA